MCVFCEKSCCKDCVTKLNDTCPNCCKKPYETRGFSRHEKKYYNSIRIKCPLECGEISSCETYYSHLNNCRNNTQKFECKNCAKIIETQSSNQDNVNIHLNFCKKKCNYCYKSFPLVHYNKHESKCIERITKMIGKVLEWIIENQNIDLDSVVSYLEKSK